MNSFYGGKQGRTYNIVQRYDSVDQMVDYFHNGGAYIDANYGQYVIIDTILNRHSKSDPENGLLYRRGFDYNEEKATKPDITDEKYYDSDNIFLEDDWYQDWYNYVHKPGGGAIYVGQIVGPQGETPEITPRQWEAIKDQAGIKKIIPVSNTLGNDDTLITDSQGNTGWNGDMIKTASLTVRDEYGNVTGAEIAFDIPTAVLEAKVINDNPYTDAKVERNQFFLTKDTQIDQTKIYYEYSKEEKIYKPIGHDQIQDVTTCYEIANHPFYYKWDFTIPKGKKGQDLKAINIQSGLEIGFFKTEDSSIQEGKVYYILSETGQYIKVENPRIEDKEEYYQITSVTYGKPEQGSEFVEGEEYYIQDPQTGAFSRVEEPIAEDFENYYIITNKEYGKTEDQELIEGKSYFILSKYIAVENPVIEDKDNYYEKLVDDDKYFTYSVRSYQNNALGEVTEHLGRWPYRVIEKIESIIDERDFFNYTTSQEVLPDGSSIIIYPTVQEGSLINLSDFGAGEGYICVAICLQGGQMAEYPNFTGEPGIEYQSGDTRWLVTNIPEAAPASIRRIIYTAGEDDLIPSRQVDFLFMDSLGKLFVVYSDQATAYFISEIDSIESIENLVERDENGNIKNHLGQIIITHKNGTENIFPIAQDLKVQYTNNDTESYFKVTWFEDGSQQNVDQIYPIRQIRDITLLHQDDITESQFFAGTYSNQELVQPISKQINRILDFKRVGDNIAVLYSDPDVRESIQGTPGVDSYTLDWKDPVTGVEYSGDKALVWKNLGPLGAQYHIQGNYTANDIATGGFLEHGFRDFTNDKDFSKYGNMSDRAGWIITIENQTTHELEFWAYDYNIGAWYLLKSLADSAFDPELSVILSPEKPDQGLVDMLGNPVPYTENIESQLNNNGLWFMVTGKIG